MPDGYLLLSALLVVVIVIFFLTAFAGPAQPATSNRFRYKYLPYPFASRSEFRYFEVEAKDQAEADERAKEKYSKEILGKFTTMPDFYAA